MKKFAMLVGNGFTIDFAKPELNPSLPLSSFSNKHIKYSPFIKKVPSVRNDLIFKANKNNQFTLIEEFMKRYPLNSKQFCELRRFLSLAYSAFQIQVDKKDKASWRWTDWLSQNADDMLCAISLNYDVILERTLDHLGKTYHRVGSTEVPEGVGILKPHGSLDFDVPNNLVTGLPDIEMRWGITTTLNDLQAVDIVPESLWMKPRMEADVIPPSLHNIQYKLSWIKRMFAYYQYIAKNIDKFVIVGCSYWDVDRTEIDFFLKNLKPGTEIYIFDLKPSKDLINKILSLDLNLVKAGFKELPW